MWSVAPDMPKLLVEVLDMVVVADAQKFGHGLVILEQKHCLIAVVRHDEVYLCVPSSALEKVWAQQAAAPAGEGGAAVL